LDVVRLEFETTIARQIGSLFDLARMQARSVDGTFPVTPCLISLIGATQILSWKCKTMVFKEKTLSDVLGDPG